MYVYPLNAFFQKVQWIDVEFAVKTHVSFPRTFYPSLDQSVVPAASPESLHGIGLLMITAGGSESDVISAVHWHLFRYFASSGRSLLVTVAEVLTLTLSSYSEPNLFSQEDLHLPASFLPYRLQHLVCVTFMTV